MLPYQSIGEATSALGRNLTFTEILWFDYSARKSDYFLHFHNTFFLIGIYSAISLPWMLIEFAQPAKLEKYKIQPKVRLSFSEMLKCYKDVMKEYLFCEIPMQLGFFTVIKKLGIRTGLPLPSLWEILLQIWVYLLVEDYGNYWLHRWFHTNRWIYSKVHRVHHEYTAPIGFAAPHAHWVEVIVLGIPTLVGPILAPCHVITFWLWIVLRQMEAIETHSGYDLPWNPTKLIPFYGGATFQDYHHKVGARCHCNFASVFTYCDFIYGTQKGDSYKKKLRGEARVIS